MPFFPSIITAKAILLFDILSTFVFTAAATPILHHRARHEPSLRHSLNVGDIKPAKNAVVITSHTTFAPITDIVPVTTVKPIVNLLPTDYNDCSDSACECAIYGHAPHALIRHNKWCLYCIPDVNR
ncbi:hypothetical protein BX616_001893 [Lobosporangium transversale]|uniref:Uncharacterized protein n=1 Tax=Lobosporangium transversale TaxID=64571 RepID=A0A1Y2GP61_9FUNG|nr:hypothetical protein BCR41DRAFT_396108 [Lobosporangium transversale]KAF9917117.1 hypothetical protein BX616_001893 [Lobosporangium transversale]ORZ16838.1 hypothetical protein BCR41DRAFT_396108 [Lobosporangium transversale]|eukprot:XP_021881773.1 hypothetical protein BCR41DRAFT_396108 [Lobosporangium transversale]